MLRKAAAVAKGTCLCCDALPKSSAVIHWRRTRRTRWTFCLGSVTVGFTVPLRPQLGNCMKEIERSYWACTCFFWCLFFVYHGPWISAKQAWLRHIEAHPETAISKSPRSESFWWSISPQVQLRLRSRRRRKATPRHLLWLSLSVSFAEALGNFQGDNLPSSYTWNCAECLIISLITTPSGM